MGTPTPEERALGALQAAQARQKAKDRQNPGTLNLFVDQALSVEEIAAQIRYAVEEEREACAEWLADYADTFHGTAFLVTRASIHGCAKAIRARGKR